jgi:hypothetical protein
VHFEQLAVSALRYLPKKRITRLRPVKNGGAQRQFRNDGRDMINFGANGEEPNTRGATE